MFFVQSEDAEVLGKFKRKFGVHLPFSNSHFSLNVRRRPLFSQDSNLLFQWGDILQADGKWSGRDIFYQIQKDQKDFTLSLNGRFQFFFLDVESGDFKFYNNRYQSGEFFFYQDKDLFLLSNHQDQMIDFLRELGRLSVHMPGVHNFLANGFNVSDESLVSGMKKIFPACWVEKRGSELRQVSQWSEEFSFSRKKFLDLESHLDKYESTYRLGLREYLEGRRPNELGTLLSGGHDTSFVMAQASQIFEKPIHGFTVVFPEWEFSEGAHAQKICQKFGGVYHAIDFKKQHLDLSVSLIRANHEPVVGSSLPLHLLASQASGITDTMLGGDGGDTLWAEYYPVAEYHRWVKSLPLFLRKTFHRLSVMARDWTDWERFWELEHVSSLFTQANPYPDFMRRLCTYRHFHEDVQRRLFKEGAFDEEKFSRGQHVVEFNKENFREALIEGKLYNAFLTYQAFHTSNCMKAFHMDFFMPTLDKRVVKFINDLPYEWVNGGHSLQRLSNSKVINRRFHKHALSRYLDRSEIYNRSFDIPWFLLLKPRASLLEALQKRLVRRGWYDELFLKKMFDEFKSQSHKRHELLELKNHGYRLFSLLSLEIWCMEYLDGRMTPSSQSLGLNLEEYLNADL